MTKSVSVRDIEMKSVLGNKLRFEVIRGSMRTFIVVL